MGRIQSTRTTASTNIVEQLSELATNVDNICVFNGLVINAIDATAATGAGGQPSTIAVYNDNYGSISLAPTVDWDATAGTATINGGAVASFLSQGLAVGDLIIFGSTDSASNDNTKEILAMTATVLTLSVVVGTATGDAITMTKAGNKVFATDYMHDSSAASGMSNATKVYTFTNGIICRRGLRVEIENATNIEVFVLHS